MVLPEQWSLGGDVSESEQIVISVTALGTRRLWEQPLTRSRCPDAGDHRGDLWTLRVWPPQGLRVLQRGLRSPRVLVDAFRVPKIDYLRRCSRAAKHSGATSMIDISDGLVADLQHIARDSGVCVEVRHPGN